MILALKTSDPTCEMYLLDGSSVVAEKKWLAERRLAKEILEQLEGFLSENNLVFADLTSLIVFQGPGSFTGLRIGITVMNTLAYSLTLPIVGQTGEKWQEKGAERLRSGANDHLILPEYGALPNITTPRK